MTKYGPYKSDLIEEDYSDDQVQKDLQIWDRLLDLILQLVDEDPEHGGEQAPKEIPSIALASSAIMRLCGAPLIHIGGKPKRKYDYSPAPTEKIEDVITIPKLSISGADHMAWRLFYNLRVTEELTVYGCAHSLRSTVWQRIEAADAPSLRIVTGPPEHASLFAFDTFRLLINRYYLEKPFTLIIIELACVKASDLDDLRELLFVSKKVTDPTIKFRLEIRPWSIDGATTQVQLEEAEWQSGRCLLPHEELPKSDPPPMTLLASDIDTFDPCESGFAHSYDMGVEQDERKDWTDIHPEEEKEEENALHMRKWVWRKIHELSQEMKKRRQEKGRGDGTFMYWFNSFCP